MKYLTLVRHAKSDWATSAGDHDRPLNDRGRRNAPVMARFLGRTYFGVQDTAGLLPAPDRFLSSTAVRALTTAQIMQTELGYAPEIIVQEARIYLAEPKTLLQVVREQNDASNHVVLFGHNEGISEFARKLLRRDHINESMPTCAAAIIALPWPAWSAVDWNEARLVGYVKPKLIEKRFPDGQEPRRLDLEGA